MPVVYINPYAFYKRPCPAHARLDRMNCAPAVPEYTIRVFTLSDYRRAPRLLAVCLNECLRIGVDITGDGFDFFFGYIGPSISFATISASFAFENIGRL
jgi:hypothetical protein